MTLELTSRGLPERSWVKISQIRTLSVDRLGARVASVSDSELGQALEGLREILGG